MLNLSVKVLCKNSIQKQSMIDILENKTIFPSIKISENKSDLEIFIDQNHIVLKILNPEIKIPEIILSKPFSVNELLEKFLHIINTREKNESNILHIKNAVIDTKNQMIILTDTIHSNHQKIKLTEKEIKILISLYVADDCMVDKKNLLASVWGYSDKIDTHTLESHIYKLRQKIEKNSSTPKIIITEKNAYKLVK